MTTPYYSPRAANQSRHLGTIPPSTEREWRCKSCAKLLGVCRDGQMHLRFARGHEYLVGFPVVATCRGCGSLNTVTGPALR
jgi:RNase P subunit RPR2